MAVLAALLEPGAAELAGQAQAVDGDTLAMGDQRIRLIGLDAPELDQSCRNERGIEWSCGTAARENLALLIKGRSLACVPDGRDRYGRVLARCSVGQVDISASQVAAGMAIAEFEYKMQEAEARRARKGIWAGEFDDPGLWRRESSGEGSDISLWEWLLGWLGS